MSTPYKAGVNGLLEKKLENMMPATRGDIQDYVYAVRAYEDSLAQLWDDLQTPCCSLDSGRIELC